MEEAIQRVDKFKRTLASHWRWHKDLYIILVAAISLIALLISGLDRMLEVECSRYSELTGIESSYRFIGGCYVEFDGRFIPYKEFKLRVATTASE